ncbi:LamG-like jellyroll fold domain-containing protein [Brumimicrobium aurantiacum]|uniref:T9SS C-terminal target domain-containing protein n=1 Tax=Brumimicrobium aurantiacum TaxID=1737063 RepID=A0A3E1EXC8_9FLAO|nr:LamG-like jellyroll fold domain-containing protein [Brumimicrobium aurantiacum]RFC54133.1 T9SS C-terminal target domain-containing protein [Brumimicrobium aurantiacum]
MKKRIVKRILALSLLVTSQFSFGQNPGDTTIVQGFNFNSTVRDTQIVFPDFNSNEVERIWMKYTMRCKDGLVSPGVPGQTNIGCGEWDYSCNTYITDSTRIDSIKAKIDEFIVYPQASSNNTYSTTGSYNLYENNHYDVQITSTTNETNADVTTSAGQTSSALSHTERGGRSFVLLTASQLTTAGLTVGDIDALSLYSNGSTNNLNHLVFKMKEVAFTDLDNVGLTDLTGGTEVFHGDWALSNGQNKIPFYQAFNWTGGNLLIEVISSSNNGTTAVSLDGTDVSATQALNNEENQYATLFPGNYIQADSYLGVGGSTNRTVEAWIKTTGTNGTILYWGTNAEGERFTVKVDTDGRPRLEVQNGSVRGNFLINDGEWHHLAITTEGISLTGTKMYVDGTLINNIDMNNVIVNTNLSAPVHISKGHNSKFFNGSIDDVRIWDVDLPQTTIQENMNTRVNSSHPNYTNLQLNYVFDSSTGIVEDQSGNNNDGQFINGAAFGNISSSNHMFDFKSNTVIPDITLHQADYVLSINNTQEYDSILKDHYTVAHNIIDPANGTYSSDIITTYFTYYPDSNTVYDINGNVTGNTLAQNLFTINNTIVDYYLRSPSQLEILSLVTPYGINLDLGDDGVAWYFDVTDFYPVLKNNRGLKMTRGGQWQEDIDIKFLFVHGTPTREVLDLRQIWNVDKRSYAVINSDQYYEPRTVELPSNTVEAKIKSAITGHGQEGEFIPRQHYLDINNGQEYKEWQVWMKCANNPIYPQGGTWIYDRAGWCPGMPTQVEELDVTNFITNDQIEVDYGITSTSGTSNYIVNHQIIAYGAKNFATDARIQMVKEPNDAISHLRTNPTCSQPVVTIQNSGSNTITSMTIEYSINGGTPESFDWTGSIDFLDEEEVVLPATVSFWSAANQNSSNRFTAEIVSVNGASDEYAHNNAYTSTFDVTDIVEPEFVLEVKTNSAASQNNYRIEDADGNIIMERTSLSNNTTYTDTLGLTIGCYRYIIEDSGENGIDFWANNEGTGYMRFTDLNGGIIKPMEGDFGTSYIYEFSVTEDLSTANQTKYTPSINISPIPSNNQIKIEMKGIEDGTYTIYNVQGKEIKNGSVQDLISNPTISINNWDNAVYFIHFNSKNTTTVKKFIKN